MSSVALAAASMQPAAGGSWLDRPLAAWNRPGAASLPLPVAPAAIDNRCLSMVRRPVGTSESALAQAGWALYAPARRSGATTVILAMSIVDGMCRPDEYQAFVYANGRFAGTLSPAPMRARGDGALIAVRMISATRIEADFARYTEKDPLCCASGTSTVAYRISGPTTTPVVTAIEVATRANPR